MPERRNPSRLDGVVLALPRLALEKALEAMFNLQSKVLLIQQRNLA